VPELIGIARMAAESPRLEAKRRVEYFELETRSFLTRCDNTRLPFRWTINPYRGCEYGCKYCYARYAHEFMELRDPIQFERQIYSKRFHATRFCDELQHLKKGETIALGTATDPYQPAERRYGVTRRILEIFAATAGFRLGITTKSDLIFRDLHLLREIARRHYLSVHMTITTMDRGLARLLEPMAPRPDLRLGAVRKLSAAGIHVSINCAPVMPLINDSDPSLDAVAKASARAGAVGFWHNVLFLKPCSREVFLRFLSQHFPQLLRRYRQRYERSAYLTGDYPEKIRERVHNIRKRYGLDQDRPWSEPELWPQDKQLDLFS